MNLRQIELVIVLSIIAFVFVSPSGELAHAHGGHHEHNGHHGHHKYDTHGIANASVAALPSDAWRTETCHLRGCQNMVAGLLDFIGQTYEIYDPSSRQAGIAMLPVPEVHFISRSALVKKACPEGDCDPIGWFPNKGNIVYIAADQDVQRDLYARGILVHELVHYVQHTVGSPIANNKCLTWKAREMQAYGIQYHWLRVNRVRVRTPAYNLRLAGYSRLRCDEEEGT